MADYLPLPKVAEPPDPRPNPNKPKALAIERKPPQLELRAAHPNRAPFVLVNPNTKEPTGFPLPEGVLPITEGHYQNAAVVSEEQQHELLNSSGDAIRPEYREAYIKAGWADGECSHCHEHYLVKDHGAPFGVLCARCGRDAAGYP